MKPPFSYGFCHFPMVFPWFSHGFPMVFPWKPPGVAAMAPATPWPHRHELGAFAEVHRVRRAPRRRLAAWAGRKDTCRFIYVYVCIYTYVYLDTCVYVHVYIYIYIHMQIYIYIYEYTYIYIYMYEYVITMGVVQLGGSPKQQVSMLKVSSLDDLGDLPFRETPICKYMHMYMSICIYIYA